MTPDQGRRRRQGKGGSGNASGPAAARRLGLLVFGVAFLALFLVVAISEGVGDPSVPSGYVAVVKGVPSEIGKISQDKFDHTLELTAVQGGLKKAPKPGEPQYDELKETTMKSLFESVWLQGLAEEWGIEVSDKEVADELKKVKKESFKSEAEFQKFLKESHYTEADINERVKVQILSRELQEKLKEKAPTPSQSDIENYYDAAKSTQFTQKPSRDIRLIVNKDAKKAEEAFDALSKDNSAKNWAKVAKEFSEDPSTKESGGLKKGVQEGVLEEPLNKEVFRTPEGQVEGPVKDKAGSNVFQVENETPESVQELKAVESQIKSTLAQRDEQEYFTGFVTTFNSEWTSRTFCADGYVIERCANFKSGGHPSTAPAACYEADPPGGLPSSCPAPVFQLVPALPGTVSPLEPKGKPLAQRPRPTGAALESAAAEAGLTEGAAPPAEVPSE